MTMASMVIVTNGSESIYDDINIHEAENVSLQYEHHLQTCNTFGLVLLMYSTTKL